MTFRNVCTTAFLLLFPITAAAYNLATDVDAVSGGTLVGTFCPSGSYTIAGYPCGTGAGILIGLVGFVGTKLLILMGPLAVFIIVKASISLIGSQEEDKLTKARKQIGVAIVGLMLATFSARLVEAFYAPGSTPNAWLGNSIINEEILGVIAWAETIVFVIAILIIIFTAIKVVGSFGKEDGPAEMRRTIFGMIGGVVLLISAEAIRQTLGLPADPTSIAAPGSPTPAPIITRALGIISTLLSYLAAVAVAIVIYAGVKLMVNSGSEDELTKTRQLIGRVLLGLVVIFLAYALTKFILTVITA